MKELVQKIHQSPYKAVLAITGGGSGAINQLLKHGNGSNTLLEATVPYNQKAFDFFVNGKPDKYCSEEASRNLAFASYKKALKLADNNENLLGIGVTCSLIKENERKDRNHLAYISVQTAEFIRTYSFQFHQLTRKEQEKSISNRIIEVLGDICYSSHECDSWISEHVNGKEYYNLLFGDQKIWTYYKSENYSNKVVFPGSFNPVHKMHLDMAERVFKEYNIPVDFEICVNNIDKIPLNYNSLFKRLNSLKEINQSFIGDFHFTSAPTFAEKAELFPKATFIIGWDTLKRIGDYKYYSGTDGLNKALNRIIELGTKFIVFHRIINGEEENSLDGIPSKLLNICKIIPEYLSNAHLSSKEIRNEKTTQA